jgi:hypothetical protein
MTGMRLRRGKNSSKLSTRGITLGNRCISLGRKRRNSGAVLSNKFVSEFM